MKILPLMLMRLISQNYMVAHVNAMPLAFIAKKDLGKIMKILSIIETLMPKSPNLEMAPMVARQTWMKEI